MLASLTRHALERAAPAGSDGRLSVLIYHRVLAAADPLLPNEPTARDFEETMRWVKQTFNVVPLGDGVTGLTTGRLPPRALAITFDDGYANNATVAAPILARLGLHATFFIATAYLDGGRMFNDSVVEAVRGARDALDASSLGLGQFRLDSADTRRHAIRAILDVIRNEHPVRRAELAEGLVELAGAAPPRDLMMTSSQAESLVSAGFALGGHTVNHPILSKLAMDEARDEIRDGRRAVEQIAGRAVELFAYPNGGPDRDYTATTVALVREAGFRGAVTTSPGAARVGSDPFQIPRFTPWENGALRFAVRMWSNATRVAPLYSVTAGTSA